MKLALIPPKGYEDYALRGTALMSLCIPSFFTSPAWSATVRQAHFMSRNPLHILDNGAAEGEIAGIEELLGYANIVKAHEVVLPDVLGDYEGTMKLISEFFAAAPKSVNQFDWMAPLQGKNEEELHRAALQHVRNEAITTLGIPRILIDNTGKLNARIDFANHIHHTFPGRFQIHFLGASKFWPGEIRAAATYTKVRSMDTSMPFNFTIAGLEMSSKVRKVSRPRSYFADKRTLDAELLDKNTRIAMEWASGRLVAEAPAS